MMKLTKFRILLIILALVSIIITGCNNDNNKSKSNDQPLSRTEFMMDTILTLKIYDKKDNKILDEAFTDWKKLKRE